MLISIIATVAGCLKQAIGQRQQAKRQKHLGRNIDLYI
jgi:hypothetical protein